MKIDRFIGYTGVACLIAAVLIVASQFVGLVAYISNLPMSALVKSTPAAIYNISKLAGFILLLLGLVGLYTRQSDTGGVLGLIGFLVAFLGTGLVLGDWWFEAFAVPWLADVAPHALSVPPSGTLITGGLTGFAIFATGWTLFGVGCFRASIFPRWASILLIIGGLLGFGAGYPPFLIVLALGVGWMGY